MRTNRKPQEVFRYFFIVTIVVISLAYFSLHSSAQAEIETVTVGQKQQVTNSLAWGDWDGDGDLDLALGNIGFQGSSAANEVYENDQGTLRLAWTEPIENAGDTFSVAWGDWDKDGDLDLAVGNNGKSEESILIYENKPTSDNERMLIKAWSDLGTNVWISKTVSTNLKKNTTSVAWGDWDKDGDLDLAVGNEGQEAEAIQIYENQGDGNMKLAWSDAGPNVWWDKSLFRRKYIRKVAWGDWDKDGDLDLTAIDERWESRNGSLQLYENQLEAGQASLHLALEQSVPEYRLYGLALGDWDNDLNLDFAVGGEKVGNLESIVQVYSLKGDTLNVMWEDKAGEIGSSGFSGGTFSVDWGDWERDGDLDLAVGNANSTRIYQNNSGDMQLAVGTTMPNQDFTYPSIAWGDIDNDNYLDLAMVSGFLKRGRPSPQKQFNRIYTNSSKHIFPLIKSNASWQLDDSYSKQDAKKILFSSAVTDLGDFAFALDSEQPESWYDWDNDGDLDLTAVSSHHYATTRGDESTDCTLWFYENAYGRLRQINSFSFDDENVCSGIWVDWDHDGDLDLDAVPYIDLYENRRQSSGLVNNPSYGYIDYKSLHSASSAKIEIPYVLYDDESDFVTRIVAEYSLDSGITWQPAVATTNTITTNLKTAPYPATTITNTHVYTWDTFTSTVWHK